MSDYTEHQAQLLKATNAPSLSDSLDLVVVDVGDVDDAGARWWTAILAAEGGWDASMRNDAGHLLCSPWSIRTESEPSFMVSANIVAGSNIANHRPASTDIAIRYLWEYCRRHGVAEQSQAALAAALLVPLSNFYRRKIELPMPHLLRDGTRRQAEIEGMLSWVGDLQQLDRLLALSCNKMGVEALLKSIFFEPDVACNICGAWLQGSFAFLTSDKARDRDVCLRTFIARDPGIGFLWIGAFITGADARCLQGARAGCRRVDLSAAAWTGTHASFMQDPVPKAPHNALVISRADEMRLMYLVHEGFHVYAPLFPFPPFGSTAMEDTDLDVRQHAQCSGTHGLEYKCFTWDCQDGKKVKQERNDTQDVSIRVKDGRSTGLNNSVIVDYDGLNFECDSSEVVTRNVFCWLRGDDGYPVAERAIHEHEWIADWDSDDGGPIEADVRSTAGDNIGDWLLRTSTKRSNSI